MNNDECVGAPDCALSGRQPARADGVPNESAAAGDGSAVSGSSNDRRGTSRGAADRGPSLLDAVGASSER